MEDHTMQQFTMNIETDQHEALRVMAYQERLSIAQIIRSAIELYLKQKGGENVKQ